MTAFVKFHSFSQALAEKNHDLTNDQFEVALCNAANPPDIANDVVLSDLTPINYANLSTRSLVTSSGASSSGIYTLKLNDFNLAAAGGDANPFRYVVVMNVTAAGSLLIGYLDYNSDLTILQDKSMDIDFASDGGTDGALLTVT